MFYDVMVTHKTLLKTLSGKQQQPTYMTRPQAIHYTYTHTYTCGQVVTNGQEDKSVS